jgi:branched-chain amino acid transport system substrate-binding protein
MSRELTLGLSLSLSGKYATMGRQAETAIRLFVTDLNGSGGVLIGGSRYRLALDCSDDQSRADRVREIYRDLCFNRRLDLVFGPYSSALARAAAPIVEEAGMVMVNHGGADDVLHQRGYRMIVSVLSPASSYLTGFVELLATLKFWRKRLALAIARTPFGATIAAGLESVAAQRRIRLHGVRIRLKYSGAFDPASTPDLLARALRRNRINAFVSIGGYEHDLAMVRVAAAQHLNIPVIGCIAAGVDRFGADLGDDAEGILGPSQWEPDFDVRPELGPTSDEFVRRMRTQIANHASAIDYPAAQIYSAGLVCIAALRAADELDQGRLRAAFADLRMTTFFGDFAIDHLSGLQIGHRMLLVQWHQRRKQILAPEMPDSGGELKLPSGWRLLLGSAGAVTHSRRDKSKPFADEDS